jgi:hypothetical protein
MMEVLVEVVTPDNSLAVVDNVEKGSMKWGEKVRKRTRELAATYDDANIQLAFLLWELYNTPVDGEPRNPTFYTQWGYSSFSAYATQELNMCPRKATALRSVGKVLSDAIYPLGMDIYNRYTAIGWTKLRDLSRLFNKFPERNSKDWYLSCLEKAENSSHAEFEMFTSKTRESLLVEALKADVERANNVIPFPSAAREHQTDASGNLLPLTSIYGRGADDTDDCYSEEVELPAPENLTREVFVFYSSQLLTVKEAIEKCRQLVGHSGSKKSHLLELICLDFLANNGSTGSKDEDLPVYLAKLERILGVNLIATKQDTGELVHGFTSLSDLIKKAAI